MNLERIEELVEKSKEPLPDAFLEGLQEETHGTPHRYVRFLYLLALEMKPPLSIELGTEWGVTSAHLCAAAKKFGGHVVGVDLQSHYRTLELIPKTYGNFTFLQMDSVEAVPLVAELAAKHGPLGLVFQDSTHRYKESRQEWNGYSKLFAKEAAWVFDDVSPAWFDAAKPRSEKMALDYWNELPAADKRLYEDSLHARVVMGVALISGVFAEEEPKPARRKKRDAGL